MHYSFLTALFLFLSTGLFAEEAPPMPPVAPSRDQGFGQTMLMLGIAAAFFYLILWRPEQKRRKEMDEMRDSLKKGDRVTAMGIIGTVSRVSENTVVLRMVDGAKVEFLRSAITDIQSGGSSKEESSKRVSLEQDA